MDILYDMFFDETKKKFLEYVKPEEKFYEFVEDYFNERNSLSTESFNPLLILDKIMKNFVDLF
jgi:hypothetical protein